MVLLIFTEVFKFAFILQNFHVLRNLIIIYHRRIKIFSSLNSHVFREIIFNLFFLADEKTFCLIFQLFSIIGIQNTQNHI